MKPEQCPSRSNVRRVDGRELASCARLRALCGFGVAVDRANCVACLARPEHLESLATDSLVAAMHSPLQKKQFSLVHGQTRSSVKRRARAHGVPASVLRAVAIKRAASRALGDAVAAVAQPIARGIDWLLGTNLADCAGCSGRREKLNAWGERLRNLITDHRSPITDPIPLILENRQSPGDIVVMTGVMRELHRQYPGRFVTDVRTPAGELWAHNQHVTRIADGITMPITYEGIHQSNQSGKHFMQAMADDLAATLELPGLAIDDPRGDIHLSDTERTEFPFEPPEPYWLVCSGVKSDYTAKAWPYYQSVISNLISKINFVQVGQLGHDSGLTHTHAPLDGVAVNLLGRTNHRDLIHLVAHSSGVLCGVTYLMHLAAAFRKPCVVVAGGREPVAWNAYNYPGFHLLHTVGGVADLDCCATGGCWKSRVVPLGDGNEKNRDLCLHPADGVGQCMRLITAETVTQTIIGMTDE